MYGYDKDVKTATFCESICDVYGGDFVDDSNFCRWFRKYWSRDRNYKGHVRFGRILVVSEEDLGTYMKNSPHLKIEELAEIFAVHKTTFER